MHRLSGSRSISLLVLVAALWLGNAYGQDFLGDVLSTSNTQLWKSFQEEMKTLEQAAHRVNTLLVNAHQPKAEADQEAKPAEQPEVTVLASPDVLRDGLHTKLESPKTKENRQEEKAEPELAGGIDESFNPHQLNLGSFINSFGLFKSLPEPWWKGKNVCVEKSEMVEDKQQGEKEVNKHLIIMGTGTFEHCKQTSGKYICKTVTSTPQSTKTVSVTYQCCEGSRRQGNECVQVELKDPVDVLDSLGSKDFASLVKSQDVLRSLADHNITIFAPVDAAMRSLNVDFQESNQIRNSRQVRAVEEWNDITPESGDTGLSGRDVVLAHVTSSLLEVDDFTNEMVLNSSYKNSPLRMNIYPGREEAVLTINCARLLSMDNLASNARVHTVDRVLEPVTQSVVDILSQPQFSQFKQFLEQEDLIETLTNATGVTVFAPNNDAWDKLGDGLRDKYSRGEACIDKVVKHHILPLTLCAAPVSEGRLTTADMNGELVRLWREQDGQLMVDEKGRVVQEDIVATNGVVHVLDKVLTPKSAKPLSELLLSSNHTTWLGLLDRAGLMEELNRQENITVLVPTERVLTEENTRALLDAMDAETLKRVLLYHVTQQAGACELRDRASLRTQAGPSLTVTLTNPFVMFAGVEPRAAVQCAPLGHTDGKACHVTAHEITRLLLPPNSTVLQLIADNPQLTFFKRVLEGTEMEKDLELKSELLADGFTLLAPTDDSFNRLDEDVLSRLLTDKKFADEVVRTHVLKGPVCCSSISSIPWPFTNNVKTIDGRKIQVNRDRRNRVLFGNSATEKCDVIATDGIVHIVDNVLLPQVSRIKLGNVAFGDPNRQIMLFGI
ncbi:transforming growth factor-beta-induced protein ig-h3-like [Homalodisca vitripennis]|nr:transforming growth factor-beta-induced protein ig-h3-like [Homalodisca vitripennis]